jgi:ketosteroid isomerase-like protein
MAPSRQDLITAVETYFARVDAGEVDTVVDLMSPDVVLEVVTHRVRNAGKAAVREVFRRRLDTFANGWHGNFRHVADAEKGWVTSRFDVVRNFRDGRREEMNNINFFEFEGRLIKKISIWMSSSVNSLG